MIRAIAENRLNLLLVAAPISWVIYAKTSQSPWLFITAAEQVE